MLERPLLIQGNSLVLNFYVDIKAGKIWEIGKTDASGHINVYGGLPPNKHEMQENGNWSQKGDRKGGLLLQLCTTTSIYN